MGGLSASASTRPASVAISWIAADGAARARPSAAFFAFHLLGEWRVREAYRPLARLLRCPADTLKIDRSFCPEDGRTPFETVQWEMRSAAIKDESGNALFEQNDCEIPVDWTQLATNVVASKSRPSQ